MLARTLRHAAFALAFLTPALGMAQKAAPSAAEKQADKQTALTKAQEGLRLFGEDRWDEALKAFSEAYAIAHAPSIKIYIARCLRKKHQMFEARKVYQEIAEMTLPPDAPQQFLDARNDAAKELETTRQNTPTVQVQVLGAPAGAQVLVNGTPISSETRELDPGECTVEVRSGTAVLQRRTVHLDEGSKAVETIDLRPPPRTWRSSPVPGAVALGVGGVGAIVGGIFGGLALKEASDVKAMCPPNMPCPAGRSEKSTATTNSWVSTVGVGVAVVGVVTGVVLLATRTSPKAQAAVQSALGTGALTLRF